jgi:hypothetical protein
MRPSLINTAVADSYFECAARRQQRRRPSQNSLDARGAVFHHHAVMLLCIQNNLILFHGTLVFLRLCKEALAGRR